MIRAVRQEVAISARPFVEVFGIDLNHAGRWFADTRRVDDDPLTRKIIGAAIDVHRALGPGLLESAYRGCLRLELAERGLLVGKELPIPIIYRGQPVGVGYRLDLIVDDRVIIEVKAIERFEPVHTAQLLSYLRLANRPVGLLFNFNVKWLVEQGVRRVVNRWMAAEIQSQSH